MFSTLASELFPDVRSSAVSIAVIRVSPIKTHLLVEYYHSRSSVPSSATRILRAGPRTSSFLFPRSRQSQRLSPRAFRSASLKSCHPSREWGLEDSGLSRWGCNVYILEGLRVPALNSTANRISMSCSRAVCEFPKPGYLFGHLHSDAAASTMPAPLNAALFVTTISTGYFHSINCFQPCRSLAAAEAISGLLHSPQ